jgi:hypothetical protein
MGTRSNDHSEDSWEVPEPLPKGGLPLPQLDWTGGDRAATWLSFLPFWIDVSSTD